jgi:hypothetical protein
MAKSGWTVTSQLTDQTVITEAGQVIAGVNVYFTTGDGNSGFVFVPQAHYHNKETVRKLIEAEADNMDTVGAMYANPVP